jgi:hypothetical protein
MKLLLLFFICLNVSAANVQLRCYDRFTDETYDLITTRHKSCLANFAWGKENICFKGDAEELVDLINDEYFDNSSSGYMFTDAMETRDGVSYLGVDQQSFWQGRRLVKPCL